MGIPKALARLIELLQSEGLMATQRKVMTSLRARIMRWSDRRWECENHIKTIDEMSLDGLAIEQNKKKHGFDYVPSFCRLIHNLIWNVERQLESTPYQLSDCVFIDYGSGKGQALMAAAEYPFKELIGVEFSTELHQIAIKNLDTYRKDHPQASPIRSVNTDATEFDIPDQPCLLYFYNPFDEYVMSTIIRKIRDRTQNTPYPIYIIYAQLREEDPYHVTKNISLISGASTKISVAYRSLLDRFLLASHLLSINCFTSNKR